MTKLKDIGNKNNNKIIYYCNNHRLNTFNKKLQFKNAPCNGKIEYLKNQDSFYIIHEHNNIFIHVNIKIYDDLGDITNNYL